jgi:hypothetical protein
MPKLICIGIIYEDKKCGVDGAKCKTLAHRISDFYKKNSRKELILVPSFATVKVPYKCQPKNVNRAEQYAIKKHPGYDFYAIVVTCISVAHAGNKIAHLINFLDRDGQHEVGHLLGLEHAGAFSGGKLEDYGDALSVMGKFPSGFLTAPQYIFKGWMPKDEIVEYEGTEQKTFTLKRVTNFDGDGISAVIIKRNGRNACISCPQPTKFFNKGSYLALHLYQRGGSQKIKAFNKEFFDTKFTGLHIKIISKVNGNVTFTVDYATKGLDYESEPDEIVDEISYPPDDNVMSVEELENAGENSKELSLGGLDGLGGLDEEENTEDVEEEFGEVDL